MQVFRVLTGERRGTSCALNERFPVFSVARLDTVLFYCLSFARSRLFWRRVRRRQITFRLRPLLTNRNLIPLHLRPLLQGMGLFQPEQTA
jgi:hypothetical protein